MRCCSGLMGFSGRSGGLFGPAAPGGDRLLGLALGGGLGGGGGGKGGVDGGSGSRAMIRRGGLIIEAIPSHGSPAGPGARYGPSLRAGEDRGRDYGFLKGGRGAGERRVDVIGGAASGPACVPTACIVDAVRLGVVRRECPAGTLLAGVSHVHLHADDETAFRAASHWYRLPMTSVICWIEEGGWCGGTRFPASDDSRGCG